MGRKGSEISPSKRYPLRSTHNSGRVLRSATNKSNTACSEPLNDSATQPAGRKRKSGNSSGSPNNSVRVLRSASKKKVDLFSESLNDSIPGHSDANKRKGIRLSKAASPINSVRVLRSASKNEDETCSETLNRSTIGKQTANGRKLVTPLKVGGPNNSLRVLHSSNNKSDTYSEPLNGNTVVQPSVKKRKGGSPLKVGSPASSARVLRSNSKRTNKTLNEPLNDNIASQPVSRKRKSDTPPKGGSPKLGVRVLRSASKIEDADVEPLNVSTPVQPAVKKRISGRSSKERSPKKDYLKIYQRVKYVLNRMNYEQSLIQAYSGEGWRGQSLDKIRPQKELERAKAEILRCKIKIREAFRNMDLLLSEGKLEESLFDSAGQIFSEDIFCAICGSKDVTLKNDIILCDGACDRGFHQNCLNPPLRTEDIPPGDEGWFCPACVCKIDCIHALNELQGSKLSVYDSWEKVFPDAALLAHGSSPKDDVDNLGLPSDDSEDDDFDPADSDSSEERKCESHSDESDFTSDSDDFCVEIAKSCDQGEIPVSPLSNVNEEICKETELDHDVVLPVSSRRQVERLDYKKLYDEAYGEESSSSSDDEEWSGKEKLEDSETDGSFCPAKRRSRRASAGHPNSQHTRIKQHYGSVCEERARSNGSNGTSRYFGPTIKQKLKGHFEKDPYPSRTTKENLAQELGLTFIQVDKWFASTRHSSRVAAAKKGKHTGNHNTGNNNATAVDSSQVRVPNDGMLAQLTADRNGIVHEEVMVQNNLYEGNKEDILLSRSHTETEAYGKESSDPSDDKEWSGTRTSQKELEDTETDSLAASYHAKRLTRKAPIEPQNNEHTPLSERLHGSIDEQQIEAPCSYTSSSARKFHFGPLVNQKLKAHFEKDPYPSRSTVQSLAQELGLTSIQVRRWFKSSRHHSSVSTSKKGKDPGNHTNEKNDSTTVDSIQGKERNTKAMENPTKDRNDTVSPNFMLQINLNEGNDDGFIISQHPSCEETVAKTSTAILREGGPPGYMHEENNQGNGALWSTGFEQGLFTTPTSVSREVGPPGFGPGENQGYGESWNTISEQRILMTPTTTTMSISQEVGPPGYGPGENQVNNASWTTSSEQRWIMTPNASSSIEACPPGYGPGINFASWNTSSELRVDAAPSTNPIEVGPPGYWPGENQGNRALWNKNSGCEESVFMTPTATTLSDVGPPGYWPREDKGSGASTKVGGSPKGRSAEKSELDDEARKKAIARELRRMKKFR